MNYCRDNVSPTRIISRRSNKVAAGFGDCLAETRQRAYRGILFGAGVGKNTRANLVRSRLSSDIAYLCKRFSHPHMCGRYISTQEADPMLVLTRIVRESVRIDADITVTVLHVRGDQVRIRVSTPRNVGVYRGEIVTELSHAAERALSPGELSA
jgi:carbon storage regulator